jgi:hypothetical protein
VCGLHLFSDLQLTHPPDYEKALGRDVHITHRPFVWLACLAAIRKIWPDQCFCENSLCASDCIALSELFGQSESCVDLLTSKILQTVYGTSDLSFIRQVSAHLRPQKLL